MFLRIGQIQPGPRLEAQADREIDATDRLVSPPFVDSHFHLDSTLSYGQPRVNQSGTLLEGIELWGEFKSGLTVDNIKARAAELCRWKSWVVRRYARAVRPCS